MPPPPGDRLRAAAKKTSRFNHMFGKRPPPPVEVWAAANDETTETADPEADAMRELHDLETLESLATARSLESLAPSSFEGSPRPPGY